MHIVIDAYQANVNQSGTDRVARNMLREFAKLDQNNKYTVLINPVVQSLFAGAVPVNFELLSIKPRNRTFFMVLKLPRILRQLNADVFFSFHNFAGPIVGRCPSVVSALDAIPFTTPNLYFGEGAFIRRIIVTAAMKRAAVRASKIVAISSYTRSEVVDTFHIDTARVDVVYLQADPVFFEEQRGPENDGFVAAKYGLPAGYVLALGGSEPRKNVWRVIAAHQLLPEAIREKFPLLIGGANWHGVETNLDHRDPHVRSLGFIDEDDLPSVYRLASVYVFPSLYEGFGMTILEAMASGTPVVTSTTTSIPETAGDAAILIDPENVTELHRAIELVLSDEQIRDDLIESGTRNISRFSWSAGATQILNNLITVGTISTGNRRRTVAARRPTEPQGS